MPPPLAEPWLVNMPPSRHARHEHAGESRVSTRRSFGLVVRHIFAWNIVRKFGPKRIIRTPDHAALSDIIPSNLEHEFVGDGSSADTCNFCTTIREVAQNARAVQMALRVMDCGRRIPLNTKVSSALALHSDIPIVLPVDHCAHEPWMTA
jgi:hypothetical protein